MDFVWILSSNMTGRLIGPPSKKCNNLTVEVCIIFFLSCFNAQNMVIKIVQCTIFQMFHALRQAAGYEECVQLLWYLVLLCSALRNENCLDHIFWESCLSSLPFIIVVKTDWLELMDAARIASPCPPWAGCARKASFSLSRCAHADVFSCCQRRSSNEQSSWIYVCVGESLARFTCLLWPVFLWETSLIQDVFISSID